MASEKHACPDKTPAAGRDLGGEADLPALRAELAVFEERISLLYEVTENLREVVWLTDWQLNEVLYVSPAYEAVWGCLARELYDHPASWMRPIHPEDRPRVEAAFRTRAEAGTYEEEYRIVHPGGAVRWVHDRAVPIRDESGRVVRMAGISTDITCLKQAQQELENQLNLRIAELTAANREYQEVRAERDRLLAELAAARAAIDHLLDRIAACPHCRALNDLPDQPA